MPEGDVIHRTAARLEEALLGREIVAASSPSPRAGLGRAVDRLIGQSVEAIEARGKHLLIRFGDGVVLHNHLGMRGRWRFESKPSAGDPERGNGGAGAGRRGPKPWLVLETAEASAVQLGGSRLRMLSESQVRRDPQLVTLGPDVLAGGFDPADGAGRLRRLDQQMGIGEALLDQRALAGIGNVYRCEGLFAAAISPWRSIGELTDDELATAVAETAALMRTGLGQGRPASRVHRRAGRPCPRCGARIRSRPQGDAGRTTYWCPGCQR